LFLRIHGIIERCFPPTFPNGCSAVGSRRENAVGAPARF
jgi:hypothetical protein